MASGYSFVGRQKYGVNVIETYFKEIVEYPLLTNEQEVKLGKALKLRDNIKIVKSFLEDDNSLVVDLGGCFASIDSKETKDYVFSWLRYYYDNNNRQGAMATRLVKKYLDSYDEFCKTWSLEFISKERLEDFYAILDDEMVMEADMLISGDELRQQVDMFLKYMVARDILFDCNLRLVVSMACSYSTDRVKVLDLVQEGNIGLIKAVDNYDVDKGCKFSTYAVYVIKAVMWRFRQKNEYEVMISYYVQEQWKKINSFRTRYYNTYGVNLSWEEVASEFSIPVSKIMKIKSYFERFDCCSLEEVLENNDDSVVVDNVVGYDSNYLIDDLIEGMAIKELIDLGFSELSFKEKVILKNSYGIGSLDVKTNKELGELFGISRQRVSQINNSSFLKVREKIRSKVDYRKSDGCE